MLSKNSPNLCRWRDELLLLFECFDFLGYKRTLVLLTEMYYNIISRKEKGLIILREMDCNAHSVFLLYYHLVMVVKYRRKVIDDQISGRAQPKSEISKFINAYKSASSRLLKKEYPQIRERLWEEAF